MTQKQAKIQIPKEVLEQIYAEVEARVEARFKPRIESLEKECERWKEAAASWKRRYFKMEERALKAEGQLALKEIEIKELKATIEKQAIQIAELQKKVFGPKSEKGEPALEPESSKTELKRKRGKQPGSKGYGRKLRDGLPFEEVTHNGDLICPDCSEPTDTIDYEESEEVEVEVGAYRRIHRRRKSGHFCLKKKKYVIATAPVPAKLFPRAMFGISFWSFILTGKYYLQSPINRLRLQLAQQGLDVSEGTIIAGLERLLPLYKPLYDEIKNYTRTANHWHIDDTGWKVFTETEDKEGFNWYMWVFLSQDACLYIIDPSRARKVPQSVLKDLCGAVTSDRLSANRKLGDNITNTWCWVHERREFLKLSKVAAAATIAKAWLELIANMFHFNGERLLHDPKSAAYKTADKKLRDTLKTMKTRCDKHLATPGLHPELKRVFKGMQADWDGLSFFLEHPTIPPENNKAERALRNPVVGRKNYYGSFSNWSAEFAAVMFSIHQTLLIHGVNLSEFHREYLTACANNRGKPPENAASFLPWNRSKKAPSTP